MSSSSTLESIIAEARTTPKHVVLAEGEDARVVRGGLQAVEAGIAEITLVGSRDAVTAEINAAGGDPSRLRIEDPTDSALTDALVDAYFQHRHNKLSDLSQAREEATQPLGFAALMVRQQHADATIAGAVATTAQTVRSALQILGPAPGCNIVSSFFLMILDQPHHQPQGAIVFADCGLVVNPNPTELAEIAVASARSYENLIGEPARVAMLSFSTHGSALHADVDKITAATALVREQAPDVFVDGEIQFDAAFVPEIASTKAPNSPLEGQANVFVFPDLDAANIGYKIAQRIGGAKAIGPILQGLSQPANDLSRGCSAEDVFNLIAITSIQANHSA